MKKCLDRVHHPNRRTMQPTNPKDMTTQDDVNRMSAEYMYLVTLYMTNKDPKTLVRLRKLEKRYLKYTDKKPFAVSPPVKG
jgi:hypothetical protein